jgi:hypothetical protein
MERKNPFLALRKIPILLLMASVFKNLVYGKVMGNWIFPNLIIIRKWGIAVITIFSLSMVTLGQVNGDYQTRATGNWNANTTWQVWNATTVSQVIIQVQHPVQVPLIFLVVMQSHLT